MRFSLFFHAILYHASTWLETRIKINSFLPILDSKFGNSHDEGSTDSPLLVHWCDVPLNPAYRKTHSPSSFFEQNSQIQATQSGQIRPSLFVNVVYRLLLHVWFTTPRSLIVNQYSSFGCTDDDEQSTRCFSILFRAESEGVMSKLQMQLYT